MSWWKCSLFSGVSCWSKHWVGGKKLVEIIDSRWHFQLAAALTFSSWEKNIPKLDSHLHLTSSVNESPNVVPTCPVLMVGSVIESESGLLDNVRWSQEVVEEFSRKISLFQNYYHRCGWIQSFCVLQNRTITGLLIWDHYTWRLLVFKMAKLS